MGDLLGVGRSQDVVSVADEWFETKPGDLHVRVGSCKLFGSALCLCPVL